MAKVSNEVKLIIALWKEKLGKKREELAKECISEAASKLPSRELDGIDFAENRLVEIISDLEEGKL